MLSLPKKKNTKSRRYVYGRSPAECQQKYADALNAGAFRVRPGSISEFVTLHFTAWLQSRVSALSYERYDVVWRHHVGKHFGALRFDELTPSIIQDRLMLCGNSSSARSLSKSLLGQIVSLAIAHEVCRPEVLMAIKISRTGQRVPKKRTDIVEKANAIFEASRGTIWEGPFWLMITLGLRWGEVCGLKCSDLNGDTLTIQRQRNNKVGEVPYPKLRKPGESRIIGLPPELADRLRSYINGQLYMFHGPDGKPLDYSHNERKLAPFMKAAKVDAFTVHDFRSAAIVMLYGRVDEKTYYNLFGHHAINQTREYLDSSEKQTREALRILVDN